MPGGKTTYQASKHLNATSSDGFPAAGGIAGSGETYYIGLFRTLTESAIQEIASYAGATPSGANGWGAGEIDTTGIAECDFTENGSAYSRKAIAFSVVDESGTGTSVVTGPTSEISWSVLADTGVVSTDKSVNGWVIFDSAGYPRYYNSFSTTAAGTAALADGGTIKLSANSISITEG